MDYAGYGKRNAYKVNRPITDEEQANRLAKDHVASADPNDYLSAIKVNSTYLELVDRWYPIKGFWVWLGFFFTVLGGCMVAAFLWMAFFAPTAPEDRWMNWLGVSILGPISLLIAWAGIGMVRSECFRWTHYPMRLNRKTRQVHVFRQDGTVLTTPWDELFIVLANATTPPIGKTFDLRAHVLAEDRKTVLESFSLGYVFIGNEDSIRRLWEFIRRYMEAPDGAAQANKTLEFCLPLDGRKEGWAWGVARTFMTFMRWPPLQLVASLVFSWVALGRCLAMSTSRQPHWPAEVEAASVVDPDDPFQKNWRDNPPLTAFQKYWTAFCFVAGLVGSSWILWSVVKAA